MRRAAIAAVVCLLVSAPLAFAATTPPTETYTTLVHQIDSGQVAVAHVNESTHDIRVTLKSGSEQFVVYPPAQHKTLIDSLLHHGVTPIYTKHKHTAKPVHHVLRYVAAGVVVVLLLIGGGVWAYTRGPRKHPSEPSDAPSQS